MYVWIGLMEAVAELTRYDFEKVSQMSVMEFFAYVCYINWKRTKERLQLEDFRRKNRMK